MKASKKPVKPAKAVGKAEKYPNLKPFKPGQSGNPEGMKPGTVQVGTRIRQAFMNVLTKKEKSKTHNLEKVLEKCLKENPLQTLSVIAKFLPKELNVDGKIEHDHSVKHTGVQETRRWARELLGRGDEGHDSESLPN